MKVDKFRCGDESGVDWFGSDEPYWVFTAKTDNDRARTTRSQVFSNVDSGDVRPFNTADNRNVVWPGNGAASGAAGPIGLSIQLWENDQGDPDKVRAVTETTLNIAGAVLPWVNLVPGLVREQIIDLIRDDVMGSHTLQVRAERLARLLPNVGDSRPMILHFHGRSGDLPFDVAGGPDYDLHLRLIRTA
ncbi:hypothetical protein ACWGE0_25980 [Lentzea sp. NPDC054927]